MTSTFSWQNSVTLFCIPGPNLPVGLLWYFVKDFCTYIFSWFALKHNTGLLDELGNVPLLFVGRVCERLVYNFLSSNILSLFFYFVVSCTTQNSRFIKMFYAAPQKSYFSKKSWFFFLENDISKPRSEISLVLYGGKCSSSPFLLGRARKYVCVYAFNKLCI